ncbi:MAG TPA: 2-amino-4-hydroxy-6-hydroxymethyldihydropteridine diphosphokinase [Gammaproteobacteria bacterium]|nr:2-amino-4-hydroxy-6-hydroxymethyldihydropteridine diphosphokinase [Gammaproteobacteria bacterium]|tara:strand:+ start:119 stop:649 length:531 start_codon:yes stop_codon:yes gene_type:complete
MTMAQIYIGVGSNCNAEKNIASALRSLMRHFGKLKLSKTYATEPVGCEGKEFYNLVLGCDSSHDVQGVIEVLKTIESAHGREHLRQNYVSITLDLDLLTYDDLQLQIGNHRIPSTDISNCAYVLKPLAEIAPKTRHPEVGESYEAMWEKCVYKGGILRNVTTIFSEVYRLNESLKL